MYVLYSETYLSLFMAIKYDKNIVILQQKNIFSKAIIYQFYDFLFDFFFIFFLFFLNQHDSTHKKSVLKDT